MWAVDAPQGSSNSSGAPDASRLPGTFLERLLLLLIVDLTRQKHIFTPGIFSVIWPHHAVLTMNLSQSVVGTVWHRLNTVSKETPVIQGLDRTSFSL